MQDPVISRLHRIKGQVEAIERMYIKDKCDCIAMVEQIQAARAALGKVAEMLLSDEAKRCADEGDFKELRKVVEKTFRTI